MVFIVLGINEKYWVICLQSSGSSRRTDYWFVEQNPKPASITQAQSTGGVGKLKEVSEARFIPLNKTEPKRKEKKYREPVWTGLEKDLSAHLQRNRRNSVAAVFGRVCKWENGKYIFKTILLCYIKLFPPGYLIRQNSEDLSFL